MRARHEGRPSFPRFGLANLALITLCLLTGAGRAAAQTGRNVLLVVNGASPASVQIGDYYAKARGVPADQIVTLQTPTQDEVTREDFNALIEQPLRVWFAQNAAHDRIFYLVLTKGVPLRVGGTSGLQGNIASVDSELTLLYRKLTGKAVSLTGRVDNPYYLGTRGIDEAKPFSHDAQDIFLVSRLDGFTTEDVLRLIDRGKAPVSRGTFVLDMRAALLDRANAWLQTAADRLGAAGFKDRVILDATSHVVVNEQNVLGYYSWGSNDTAVHQRTFGFTFVPGALAAMFVSTDGRTFTTPPDTWNVGTWDKKETYYAGAPQSLAGDLIRAGVTGIAGHVAEPFLDATIRPEILFPAYVAGFNLIEAYYLAMPYLSWQTVVVGDPLCAPFPRPGLPATALDPPIDPTTGLPVPYTNRRFGVMTGEWPAAKADALKLLMRSERRLAQRDVPGAKQALEEATTIDPAFTAANRVLATLYEQTKEYDKAVDRYQRVLEKEPNDVLVLNNLAFALATRQGKAADARPLAERAYTISRGAPLIADTLGWVFHLLGDSAQALKFLQQAVTALPKHGEVRYHYAAVLAAAGDRTRAAQELTAALDLDPSLKTRDDVVAVQKGLSGRAR